MDSSSSSTSTSRRLVLHVDLDAFFVQVHRHMEPALEGQAVAIQQHQDIIAVSYEARRLGVHKHMKPQDCRSRFPTVKLVHAFTIGDHGDKVSYAKYRRAAASIFKVVRAFLSEPPAVCAFELASVDEAYLEPDATALQPYYPSEHRGPGAAGASLPGGANGGQQEKALFAAGEALAREIKKTVAETLRYVVSVGVGYNKLLAKFASQLAKDDDGVGGVFIISPASIHDVLPRIPLVKFPKCGDRTNTHRALQRAVPPVTTVLELQAKSLEELKQLLENETMANQLHQWCRGEDPRIVASWPPPLQKLTTAKQMALAPVALEAYDPLHRQPLIIQPLLPRDRDQVAEKLEIVALDLLQHLTEIRREREAVPKRLDFKWTFHDCPPGVSPAEAWQFYRDNDRGMEGVSLVSKHHQILFPAGVILVDDDSDQRGLRRRAGDLVNHMLNACQDKLATCEVPLMKISLQANEFQAVKDTLHKHFSVQSGTGSGFRTSSAQGAGAGSKKRAGVTDTTAIKPQGQAQEQERKSDQGQAVHDSFEQEQAQHVSPKKKQRRGAPIAHAATTSPLDDDGASNMVPGPQEAASMTVRPDNYGHQLVSENDPPLETWSETWEAQGTQETRGSGKRPREEERDQPPTELDSEDQEYPHPVEFSGPLRFSKVLLAIGSSKREARRCARRFRDSHVGTQEEPPASVYKSALESVDSPGESSDSSQEDQSHLTES